MAATLAYLRQLSRGRYGLEYSSAEDQMFPNAFLNQCVNDAHRWFAGVALCYFRTSMTINVVSGQGTYALDPGVIKANPRTFRINFNGGGYVPLPMRFFESVITQFGAPEAIPQGTPSGFYMHAGAETTQTKLIDLVPVPSAAATVLYAAWVYPPILSNDTDEIWLPDPDVFRLVPAICWKMAEFEASRGRQDAPVGLWQGEAVREAMELQREIREGTIEIRRTPEVHATPLEQAMERRSPNIGLGGRA